jgi:ankyrin repeat protein
MSIVKLAPQSKKFPPHRKVSFSTATALSSADSIATATTTISSSSEFVEYDDINQNRTNNSSSTLSGSSSLAAVGKRFNHPTDTWHCHCCGLKNTFVVDKCKVCGRPESYALGGVHLPFHGDMGSLYRASQVVNVLDDIHEVDNEKWTALHSACAHGNLSIVKQLLDFKTHLDALTERGHTPLHLAVYSGSVDCVRELLRRGAFVNVNTFEERTTPLHMACEKGFAKIAQLLLQAQANVHAENVLGRTPLHGAALAGRVDIALLLLRAGARLHAVDYHGWEACQIAELMHHSELHELLIREGMVEKQAVLKDLPPAKWDSVLWQSVVRTRGEREREFNNRSAHEQEAKQRIQHLQDDARKKRLVRTEQVVLENIVHS